VENTDDWPMSRVRGCSVHGDVQCSVGCCFSAVRKLILSLLLCDADPAEFCPFSALVSFLLFREMPHRPAAAVIPLRCNPVASEVPAAHTSAGFRGRRFYLELDDGELRNLLLSLGAQLVQECNSKDVEFVQHSEENMVRDVSLVKSVHSRYARVIVSCNQAAADAGANGVTISASSSPAISGQLGDARVRAARLGCHIHTRSKLLNQALARQAAEKAMEPSLTIQDALCRYRPEVITFPKVPLMLNSKKLSAAGFEPEFRAELVHT
jgi:hypothetical protein